MTGKADDRGAQLLDQAAEVYFQAMKTGLKLQEEMTTRWSKLVQDSAKGENWPARMQETMTQAIPQVKDNTEQVLKIFEQSTRQSMDLLSRAFTVGQAGSPIDAQQKLQQLWEASLATLNNSAQSMIQTNARLMQNWAEFVRKNVATAGGERR